MDVRPQCAPQAWDMSSIADHDLDEHFPECKVSHGAMGAVLVAVGGQAEDPLLLSATRQLILLRPGSPRAGRPPCKVLLLFLP